MSRKQSEVPGAGSESVLVRLEYAVLIGLVLFGAGVFVGARVLNHPTAATVADQSAPAITPGQEAPADAVHSSGAQMADIMRTNDPAELVSMGNRFYDDHQVEAAIAAYEKALKLGPDNPDVRTDLGTMYRERGLHSGNQADLDKALEEFTAALKLNPKHENALFNTGVVALDKKNMAMAIGVWKKLIQQSPNSPMAAEAKKRIAEAEGSK